MGSWGPDVQGVGAYCIGGLGFMPKVVAWNHPYAAIAFGEKVKNFILVRHIIVDRQFMGEVSISLIIDIEALLSGEIQGVYAVGGYCVDAEIDCGGGNLL